MRLNTWLVGCGATLFFFACNNNGEPLGTSGGTTGAPATTTGGRGSSSSGTTGSSTTGPAPTTSGTTSGTTSSGSSGSTSSGTGTTTGTTTSGTAGQTGGTTTSGSGGSTGYVAGPPYLGYDGGPIPEPVIAAGCTAAAPFINPTGNFPSCVSCRRNSDCPTGLFCDTNIDPNSDEQIFQCVTCRSNTDCAVGEICEIGCQNLNVPPFFTCQNACQPDCRTAPAGTCNPGLCDGDGGECLLDWCAHNSDCVVNGTGACDFTQSPIFPPGGLGTCEACTQDAGGCGPEQVCGRSPNTGQNFCQVSCLVDSGVCAGTGTFCSDAGTCVVGCQSASDCLGSPQGSICHQGQCVSCLNLSDCPDYNAGCNTPQFGGSVQCGICSGSQDCPGTHCENVGGQFNEFGNQCGCHSDTECEGLPQHDAPVCLGLNASDSFPNGSGRCACTDSSQCVAGFVCEKRYPFTVTVNTSGGQYVGGACIPQCQLVGGTNCATAGIGPVPGSFFNGAPPPEATACNFDTGYCVACAGDTDCYKSPSSPFITPSCVQFTNGIDPSTGEGTGGGVCGCSQTNECNDNYACWNPGLSGACQPACTLVNGQDSCNPFREAFDSPPVDPFCDTWTGACVQCLDSYGCTNITVDQINGQFLGQGFPAPICTSAGQCVGCNGDSDCPASAPNCTQGFCGYCGNNNDCFADAGFTCVQFNGPNSGGTCEITKCKGDSNQVATDAGFPCPSGLPYCAQTEVCGSFSCTPTSICAACRPDYNDCNNVPPGFLFGECEQNGTCVYFD